MSYLRGEVPISIVIPVHNEEKYISKQIGNLVNQLKINFRKFELILVENGSTDTTLAKCKILAKQSTYVKVISIERPDYGLALRRGLSASSGKVIINFDLDYYDINFTKQAIALEPFGYDIIIASKNLRLSKDMRKSVRRVISSIYKYILYYGFGLVVTDTHGIKAWRNDKKLKELIRQTLNNREIFDTELIIRSQYDGRKLLELPIEVRELRKSVTNILPRAWRGFKQIVRLWIQLKKEASAKQSISGEEEVKKEHFYEDMAENFGKVMSQYEVNKRLDIIFNKLLPGKTQNKTLLDAGCGIGLFSEEAEKRKAKVTSLDVGDKLLREVRKRCKAKLVKGSTTKLPFRDNAFDVVMATEVIEHTTNPRTAFKELARVTKPGGKLIVTVPNRIWRISVYVADMLNIRPYHGNENWVGYNQIRQWASEENVRLDQIFGFNIIPYFHPRLHKLISYFDRFGNKLGPVMVNIAMMGTKIAK